MSQVKTLMRQARGVGHIVAGLAVVVGLAGYLTTESVGHDILTGRATVGSVTAVSAAPAYQAGSFIGSAPTVDRALVQAGASRFLITGLVGPQVGQAVEVRQHLKGGRTLCAVVSGACYELWDDATALDPVKVDQRAAVSASSLRIAFFFLLGFGGFWIFAFGMARVSKDISSLYPNGL